MNHNSNGLELTYKIEDLLKVLNENREKHAKNYNTAIKVFRAQRIKWFENNLKAANEGGRVETALPLPRPTNYAKEYERAIKLFEMSTQKEIVLTEQLFRQYVMDEWHWQNQFEHSTMCYTMDRDSSVFTGKDDEELNEIPVK